VGTTAVVTGANSGIGLATALRLASGGGRVFATSRSAAGLEAIEAAAGAAGALEVVPIQLDVTDDASVATAFSTILGEGGVDVLVNNAGITGSGSVEETPTATYQAMFDTNVLGVVRCTQQVLPSMRAAGSGRIVNISSSSAILSPPLMGPYASTKLAVEGLSESLQSEVAPFGIRVVVVQAGTILTPIWGKADPPPEDTVYPQAREFLLKVLTHNLMGSGVPPETVAEVIAAAVADDDPAFRQLVGDADVLDRMRRGHDDAALMDVWKLDGEDFAGAYTALSGIDYWA
jgi:NAD(P)-dependent dehydrogenase (short-subunit alcohol dehydrogenase family)